MRLFFVFILIINFYTNASFAHSYCDPYKRDEDGWLAIEKENLGSVEAREIFRRPDHSTLTIQLENKKVLIFKDEDDDSYYYLEYYDSDRDYALISFVQGNHVSPSSIFINLKNGQKLYLEGEMTWSPENKYFAVNIDNEIGPLTSDNSGAEIYSCINDECKKIYHLYEYRGIVAYWLSSNHVVFTLGKGFDSNAATDQTPETEYRLHVYCKKDKCLALDQPEIVK